MFAHRFCGNAALLHPGDVPRSGTARSYCNCKRHFTICCQTVFLKWLHHFAESNWFSKISDKIKIWENPKARNESTERAQSCRVERGPEGRRGAHTEEHHLHQRRSVQMSAHPQRPHRQVLPLMRKPAKETRRRKPEECGGDVKQPLGTVGYELSGEGVRRRGALGCSPVAPTTISRKCLYDAPESNCSTGR